MELLFLVRVVNLLRLEWKMTIHFMPLKLRRKNQTGMGANSRRPYGTYMGRPIIGRDSPSIIGEHISPVATEESKVKY